MRVFLQTYLGFIFVDIGRQKMKLDTIYNPRFLDYFIRLMKRK